MTPWQAIAIVCEFVAWLTSPPATLADAGRREAVRREVVGAAVAVLSNDTLPAAVSSTVPMRPDLDPAPTTGTDETAWRERVARLNSTIRQDEAEIVQSEGRLAVLQRQVTAQDDPAAQSLMRQQIVQMLELIADIGRRVEAGRRAIDALREEARRLDIPPGWLRD